MINSRTVTVTFFFLLLILVLARVSGYPVHPAFYIILGSLYFFVSVAFSFLIRSGYYMNVFCNLKTTEKKVFLTFDDGPDPVITPQILDILKGHGKASFFLIGNKISGNEELIRRMDAEGQLTGNHSFSHSNWFDFFPVERMKNELEETDRRISEIIGKKPNLFRPPFGVINPLLKKTLKNMDYQVIGFSNRSLDTVTRNPEKTLSRLKRNLKPGDIILLHDCLESTPAVLSKFLVYLEETGYSVIGLDEIPFINPYLATNEPN